ncbi:MAG: ParB/RepB/Spo0J family partition protein [Bacillota bacterium]|nr:ParB/RepB/Spo0J family partition protein [Bacillota bacterium]
MSCCINAVGGKGMFMMIPIIDLLPNRYIPRKEPELFIEDLAESIKLFGIIEPLIVHRVSSKFEVICGERRRLAAQKAGLENIPAIVYEHINDDGLLLLFSCVENTARKNLCKTDRINNIIKLNNYLSD